MKNICFCFQMSLPYSLKRYRFFDMGTDHYYYDEMHTSEVVEYMVNTSYMPLCKVLEEMISMSKQRFRCALAISGLTIEMFEIYNPAMIDMLRTLAQTGCVEFVAVPYSYSLASEYSESEFIEQLNAQQKKIKDLFKVTSTTVFNTELMFNDERVITLEKLGYKTQMIEGAKQLLGGKSPNMVFHASIAPKMTLLARNMDLSDEWTIHFSDPNWYGFPFDSEKYVRCLNELPEQDELFNIWVGADTFGCRQNQGTGIFEFLKMIPYYALSNNMKFVMPSEAAKKVTSDGGRLSSPETITWSGAMKNVRIYNGNDLQQEALQKLFAVADRVHLCKDKTLKLDWLKLQSVEHFQNMNFIEPGITRYESAYDAFINYMNILSDFLERVAEQYPITIENEELNELLTQIDNQNKQITKLESEVKKLRAKK
ncbi:MAG: alpha-amylase [Paludibacteraceae bacterium]|nr:alpha-amylase [Paludibacteraceae bacterium]